MKRPAAKAVRSRSPQPRAEINVTPLVDVCLVLLIIFMVVTPLLRPAADVEIPATRRPGTMPETPRQLAVTLRLEGPIEVGDRVVGAADLLTVLKQERLAGDDRKVVLRADRRLPYRQVKEVARTIRDAGFSRLGLITRRDGAETSPMAPGDGA